MVTSPSWSSSLSPVTETFSSNGATWIKNMITWQHDKSGWRRWERIAWRVKCRHIKLSNWSIMLFSHYWEATEWNVDLSVCVSVCSHTLSCMGVKLHVSGERVIDCWPAQINFQQASSGEQWRWIIIVKGLMCFTPRSTKWMAGLLICPHLSSTTVRSFMVINCWRFQFLMWLWAMYICFGFLKVCGQKIAFC